MTHKILIVDDDMVNVALVKFGLAERRYKIVEARDGDEGLEKVKSEQPDLIILDVRMPRMSGYEFLSELKSMEQFNQIPVIMLTAAETLEDVFKLEGVKGYFVKPVELLQLLKKITECLGPNPAA